MDHITEQDATIEKLRYALGKQSKNDRVRVSIPTKLLSEAKSKLEEKTDYTVTITNQILIA